MPTLVDYVVDTFAGLVDTLLSAHSPETGLAYAKATGAIVELSLNGTGGLKYGPSGVGPSDFALYYNATPLPASGDYLANLDMNNGVGGGAGLWGIAIGDGGNNYVVARLSASNQQAQLYESVNGSMNLLQSASGQAITADDLNQVRIGRVSGVWKMYFRGAEVLSGTSSAVDAAITTAGNAYAGPWAYGTSAGVAGASMIPLALQVQAEASPVGTVVAAIDFPATGPDVGFTPFGGAAVSHRVRRSATQNGTYATVGTVSGTINDSNPPAFLDTTGAAGQWYKVEALNGSSVVIAQSVPLQAFAAPTPPDYTAFIEAASPGPRRPVMRTSGNVWATARAENWTFPQSYTVTNQMGVGGDGTAGDIHSTIGYVHDDLTASASPTAFTPVVGGTGTLTPGTSGLNFIGTAGQSREWISDTAIEIPGTVASIAFAPSAINGVAEAGYGDGEGAGKTTVWASWDAATNLATIYASVDGVTSTVASAVSWNPSGSVAHMVLQSFNAAYTIYTKIDGGAWSRLTGAQVTQTGPLDLRFNGKLAAARPRVRVRAKTGGTADVTLVHLKASIFHGNGQGREFQLLTWEDNTPYRDSDGYYYLFVDRTTDPETSDHSKVHPYVLGVLHKYDATTKTIVGGPVVAFCYTVTSVGATGALEDGFVKIVPNHFGAGDHAVRVGGSNWNLLDNTVGTADRRPFTFIATLPIDELFPASGQLNIGNGTRLSVPAGLFTDLVTNYLYGIDYWKEDGLYKIVGTWNDGFTLVLLSGATLTAPSTVVATDTAHPHEGCTIIRIGNQTGVVAGLIDNGGSGAQQRIGLWDTDRGTALRYLKQLPVLVSTDNADAPGQPVVLAHNLVDGTTEHQFISMNGHEQNRYADFGRLIVAVADQKQVGWQAPRLQALLEAQTDIPDTTAPTVASCIIAANGIDGTITFSESVQSLAQAFAGFNIKVGGVTKSFTLTDPESATTNIAFQMNTALTAGQTVKLGYSATTGDVEDIAGNDLVTFSNFAVTNNSTQEAPDPGVEGGDFVYRIIRSALDLLSGETVFRVKEGETLRAEVIIGDPDTGLPLDLDGFTPTLSVKTASGTLLIDAVEQTVVYERGGRVQFEVPGGDDAVTVDRAGQRLRLWLTLVNDEDERVTCPGNGYAALVVE
jgi:hypothetical protein